MSISEYIHHLLSFPGTDCGPIKFDLALLSSNFIEITYSQSYMGVILLGHKDNVIKKFALGSDIWFPPECISSGRTGWWDDPLSKPTDSLSLSSYLVSQFWARGVHREKKRGGGTAKDHRIESVSQQIKCQEECSGMAPLFFKCAFCWASPCLVWILEAPQGIHLMNIELETLTWLFWCEQRTGSEMCEVWTPHLLPISGPTRAIHVLMCGEVTNSPISREKKIKSIPNVGCGTTLRWIIYKWLENTLFHLCLTP